MNSKQHLYYALGILAYAVAKTDGAIQTEERKMISSIVKQESGHVMDFEYVEIIFSLLQKENYEPNKVYEWAMNAFRLGEHYFTPLMKEQFVSVIKKIAEAFPPTIEEEKNLIEKFSRNIWNKQLHNA